MRFSMLYEDCAAKRLTQAEAAEVLGVCPRTFQRYMARYREDSEDFVLDRRVERASARAAPVDEVPALTEQYESRYLGWNVRHFHSR